MDFLAGLAKAAQPKQSSDQTSNSDLLSSAKLVAEAAQAQFNHQPDKVDNTKVAGAAANLIDAASQYGKLDETQGVGKYIGQAEGYLRKYSTPDEPAVVAHAADEKTTPAAASVDQDSTPVPTKKIDADPVEEEPAAKIPAPESTEEEETLVPTKKLEAEPEEEPAAKPTDEETQVPIKKVEAEPEEEEPAAEPAEEETRVPTKKLEAEPEEEEPAAESTKEEETRVPIKKFEAEPEEEEPAVEPAEKETRVPIKKYEAEAEAEEEKPVPTEKTETEKTPASEEDNVERTEGLLNKGAIESHIPGPEEFAKLGEGVLSKKSQSELSEMTNLAGGFLKK